MAFSQLVVSSEVILEVSVVAHLSDEVSTVNSSFTVEYEAYVPAEPRSRNRKPDFLFKPKTEYKVFRQSRNDSAVVEYFIEPIVLGETFDADFDQVTVSFECKSCLSAAEAQSISGGLSNTDESLYFSFNETSNAIMIDPDVPLDKSFKIRVTLTDDNASGAESTFYEVNIIVREPAIQVQPEGTSFKLQDNKQREKALSDAQQAILDLIAQQELASRPTIEIGELTHLGLLTVSFSQRMKKITDLSLINDEVLQIEVVQAEENRSDNGEASQLDLTWKVVEFSENYMKIQLYWQNAYEVSAGPVRDTLIVKVLANNNFFSVERGFIPVNATDSAKIPSQMLNDGLSQSFGEAIDGSEGVTNVMLVGNIAINLVLSGALTLLWGMINCIQIIAHFDLVNI